MAFTLGSKGPIPSLPMNLTSIGWSMIEPTPTSTSGTGTRNLYVAGTEVTDVKIGSTDVNEIYVGSTLVWSRS